MVRDKHFPNLIPQYDFGTSNKKGPRIPPRRQNSDPDNKQNKTLAKTFYVPPLIIIGNKHKFSDRINLYVRVCFCNHFNTATSLCVGYIPDNHDLIC